MINPFKAALVTFKVKSIVTDEIKELEKMNTSGAGWKTSEFWSHLAVQVGTLWAAVHGFIPPKYEVIIAVVGTSVYAICRTAYKAYTDIKSATAPATQVDAQTVVVNK